MFYLSLSLWSSLILFFLGPVLSFLRRETCLHQRYVVFFHLTGKGQNFRVHFHIPQFPWDDPYESHSLWLKHFLLLIARFQPALFFTIFNESYKIISLNGIGILIILVFAFNIQNRTDYLLIKYVWKEWLYRCS